MPSSLSSTHAPRRTGDVRSPYEVRSSTAALPSRPARSFSASVTSRNWEPNDPGDAIEASQLVIEERLVGGEEIHHAAVFQKDAADEILGFLREIVPQLFVEHREQLRIGLHRIETW